MKTKKVDYTKEQTEQFLFERNAKRTADKEAKRNRPVLIHRSVVQIGHGLMARLVGVTFRGSIRDKFTGPRRNNFQAVS